MTMNLPIFSRISILNCLILSIEIECDVVVVAAHVNSTARHNEWRNLFKNRLRDRCDFNRKSSKKIFAIEIVVERTFGNEMSIGNL